MVDFLRVSLVVGKLMQLGGYGFPLFSQFVQTQQARREFMAATIPTRFCASQSGQAFR